MNFAVKPLRYGDKENSYAGIGSLGLSAVIAFLLSAETTTSTSGSPWFSLIFFGAIFAAMYFLLLRPQRRRVKESQNLQSSIAVNDEVILNSGIYGFVTDIEGDILWIATTKSELKFAWLVHQSLARLQLQPAILLNLKQSNFQ